jgi:hypothetical protein
MKLQPQFPTLPKHRLQHRLYVSVGLGAVGEVQIFAVPFQLARHLESDYAQQHPRGERSRDTEMRTAGKPKAGLVAHLAGMWDIHRRYSQFPSGSHSCYFIHRP